MRWLLVVCILLPAGCAEEEPSPREVTFAAADGVELKGRLHGTGSTAVVLSNMGDNQPGAWNDFAPRLAERGLLVLTYSYRYTLRGNNFSAEMANASATDLRAAVDYVRARGATRIYLVGASLGAMASAKVGGAVGAAGVVLMAGRLDLSDYDFRVEPAELAALTMPKLVITTENDDTTPHALTREMFDRAPEPKQFHAYVGTAHGVRIFATSNGDDLRKRLTDFVTSQ